MNRVKVIARLERDFGYLNYIAVRRQILSYKHYTRRWKNRIRPKPKRPLAKPKDYKPSHKALKQTKFAN